METEQTITFHTTPRYISVLNALVPTLDGLMLFSVINGKKGICTFRFHDSCSRDAIRLIDSLKTVFSEIEPMGTIPLQPGSNSSPQNA